MGSGYSSHGNANATNQENGGPLIDIDDDDPLIDISEDPIGGLTETKIKKMKKRACAVDSRLNANPRRKAPPINPRTCIEGSVATGKDGEPYVIHKGRWIKATKRLAQRQKELIRERLEKTMDVMKAPSPKSGSRKAAPKKAASPKRGSRKAAPKKSKSATKAKTPMRKKRCPNGSRKNKKSGKCVKK